MIHLCSSSTAGHGCHLATITCHFRGEGSRIVYGTKAADVVHRQRRSHFSSITVRSLRPFLARFFNRLTFPRRGRFPTRHFGFNVLSSVSFIITRRFHAPRFRVQFQCTYNFRTIFVRVPRATIGRRRHAMFQRRRIKVPQVPLIIFTRSRTFQGGGATCRRFSKNIFTSSVQRSMTSHTALMFLFFYKFPEFSNLLGIFLHCRDAPL